VTPHRNADSYGLSRAGAPDWPQPHKTKYIRSPDQRCAMCLHQPPCPPADHPDRDAARIVACHPEQGWSLLCNGVIVFDDMGEILPDGRVVPDLCPARDRLFVVA
jgi:hypothetical protein